MSLRRKLTIQILGLHEEKNTIYSNVHLTKISVDHNLIDNYIIINWTNNIYTFASISLIWKQTFNYCFNYRFITSYFGSHVRSLWRLYSYYFHHYDKCTINAHRKIFRASDTLYIIKYSINIYCQMYWLHLTAFCVYPTWRSQQINWIKESTVIYLFIKGVNGC